MIVATMGMGAYAPSLEMLVSFLLFTPVLVLACGNLVRVYRTRDIHEMGGAWQMRGSSMALAAWALSAAGAGFSVYNAISAALRNVFADQATGVHGHTADTIRALVTVGLVVASVLLVVAAARVVGTVCGGKAAERRGFSADRLRDVERSAIWPLWGLVAGGVLALLYGIPAMYKGITFSHYVYFGTPKQLPQSLPVVGPAVFIAILVAAVGVGAFMMYSRRVALPSIPSVADFGRRGLGIDGTLSYAVNGAAHFLGDVLIRTDGALAEGMTEGIEQSAETAATALRRARTARMSRQLAGAVVIIGLAVMAAAVAAARAGGHG
jgi:NADH:ubiquinone oxidoreductase subunit 5 (subunit L)/multisubunit Na+/H+ antiporter MnhA subunit